MEWFKRYKVCFQSILLNKYAVYIYEQTEGELVELIGSDVPFETSESDDNNIFLPIRSQTGYLRIIDTTANGSILEDLMPNNNTEKLVRLYLLDRNGNDKVLCWSGFLQAQAFTQPWGNEIKQVEFPVISVLAAMNDISIQESDFIYQHNIAWYIAQGFTQTGEKPETVKIICNLENVRKDFLDIFIETSAFFSREEQQNDNVTETKYVGSSYLEILEQIGMLYGLCFRMKNNILYIAMYDDSNGRLAEFEVPWVHLEKIANGSLSTTYSPGNVGNANLLQSVEFFGNNNVTDFNLGKKEAVVKFQIRDADDHILELPSAPENDGDSLEVKNIYTGKVFVQPFSPDFGLKASCYFYEFETTGNNFNLVGNSSYKKCLENSVIYRPLFDPYYSKNDHLITGAFLCRWLYQKDESSIPSYTSGLFMNTKYIKGPVSNFGIEDCFTIYSRHEVAIQDGYLHINMRCLNFVRGQLAGDSEKLYFGNYTSIWGQSKETSLYCILTIGDMEWTPDAGWHEKSGNANTFELKFSGENIITNKTTEMNVDESSGFFIPAPSSGLTGKLTFRICNTTKCIEPDVAYYDSHSHIITDFSVEFLRTINPLETRRGNNTYRKTIVQFGFSDVAEIELNLGTDNNNKPSDAFIKLDTKNHVETLSYPDSEGKIRKQRPEMNLLGRMFEFYKVIRRSFIGIINSKNTDELYSRRFEYLGKKFFAVEKSRNWREEKTECKFIEV